MTCGAARSAAAFGLVQTVRQLAADNSSAVVSTGVRGSVEADLFAHLRQLCCVGVEFFAGLLEGVVVFIQRRRRAGLCCLRLRCGELGVAVLYLLFALFQGAAVLFGKLLGRDT